MIGELSISNKQFGFILTEDNKFFVIAKNLNGAHDKDIVEFTVYEYRGRNEAKVVKIVKRHTDEFVGIISVNKKFAFVSIDNFVNDVYIKAKHIAGAKNGELVRIKIHYFGSATRKEEAKVIKKYGLPTKAENIVSSKIEKMGIDHKFSKEVLKEADLVKAKNIKRVDLTNLMHVTIDGEDTKDIDDAVYLEKDNEDYILYVSIADVSAYVSENSLIDKTALKRSNSVYLYDRVIPMLPRKLTNDLCSLNPNEEKLAFTVKIRLDKNAKVKEHDFMRSKIVSSHRLTYTKVNEILDTNDNSLEYSKMLFDMQELSEKLSNISNKRGSIEFEIPEIKLVLENEKLVDIVLRERKKAEILIENFMVLANEEVATFMHHNYIPCVYRVHEKPSIENLTYLNEELKAMNLNVKDANVLAKKLQKLIEKTKDTKIGYFVHKLILRSMKKAVYSKENVGHFGLGLDNYLHFTSPIRRYADLVVHRMLAKALDGYISQKDKDKALKGLTSVCNHISSMERQSQKLEYLARDIKLSEYMQDKIGFVYEGMVSSIYKERKYIILENYIEVILIDDNDEKIGDKLKVKIKEVDLMNGKIYVERV